MKLKIINILFVISIFFSSCSTFRRTGKVTILTRINFLSVYTIPYNFQLKNTSVGGLSGIDYHKEKNSYYIISDDRSDKNPARFYSITIDLKKDKIDTIIFVSTIFLKDKAGNFYPGSKENPTLTPDPEAMRYHPSTNTFVWSNEGERSPEQNIFSDPTINQIDMQGNLLDNFRIPEQFRMQYTENGPRRNGVFEGLDFSHNDKYLWVSTEEPLYNDGSRAGIHDIKGICRFIQFDMKTKQPIAQYAYELDPVAHIPVPSDGFKVNGIPDILWLGNDHFLVIERSFSVGRLSSTVKVFLADISSAQNIQHLSSVKGMPRSSMISKKLLLNMDDLGLYIDNIEGVTYGPMLSNGKRSLIFVADNNFNPLQKTQFLLFEID